MFMKSGKRYFIHLFVVNIVLIAFTDCTTLLFFLSPKEVHSPEQNSILDIFTSVFHYSIDYINVNVLMDHTVIQVRISILKVDNIQTLKHFNRQYLRSTCKF